MRVLIADDQELIRIGLSTILASDDSVSEVFEAADGDQALSLARRHRPDVCLVDLRMPGLDGVELTRHLAGPSVAEPIPVVVLTTFDSDDNVVNALRAGATGFLLKGTPPAQLLFALQAAVRGEAIIDPQVTARLLRRITSQPESVPGPREPLTDRESAVLTLIARGSTNAEIAQNLMISTGTVKAHITSLLTKVDARNRVELAIWAHRAGLIQ